MPTTTIDYRDDDGEIILKKFDDELKESLNRLFPQLSWKWKMTIFGD